MVITEAICTGNSRYKAAQKFTPRGVVLHSIGTPQPSAKALYNYWQNNGSQYVVHYMVDDAIILHCMPDNYKCWHIGSPGNAQYLGIEMGEPRQIHYTSGARFTVSDLAAAQQYAKATYKNAVWLIAQLCKKYGWDPYTAVETHYDITRRKLSNTDHVDPQHLWDGLGLGIDLAKLRKDVAAEMGGSSSAPTTPSTPTSSDHPTLRKGDRGEAVVRMQQLLIKAGYSFNPWGADGIWGDYTDSVVRAFQSKSGLSADGICGKLTWAALEAVKPDTQPNTNKTSYVVRITAKSGLNVRSGPGTNYGIVQSIPYGGGYTIIEEQNGWGLLKAYSNNRNGWIYLKYTARA